MLLATTAIILPDVSFTVPCNTSSGITRHRLPLVQFGAGLLIPSLETMGLTNGSRRPCAPKALTAGFGFSAVTAAGDFWTVCVCGAGAGAFFLVSAFFASVFLVASVLAPSLATTTGVGAPLAWVPAEGCAFTGAVVVFTTGLPDAVPLLGAGSALGVGSALGPAAALLDALAGVAAAALASDFWLLWTVFFVAGLAAPPVLAVAAGVGDGVSLAWLLA